jgi:hypothetical protein
MAAPQWFRGLRPAHSRLSLALLSSPHSPSSHLIPFQRLSKRTMTTRDASSLSDVTKVPTDAQGAFKRPPSIFRSFIQAGGQFPPEKDRYHLYVSYACPWATRTLILRKLKGLEDILPLTVVSPRLGPDGWPFASTDPYPGPLLPRRPQLFGPIHGPGDLG